MAQPQQPASADSHQALVGNVTSVNADRGKWRAPHTTNKILKNWETSVVEAVREIDAAAARVQERIGRSAIAVFINGVEANRGSADGPIVYKRFRVREIIRSRAD